MRACLVFICLLAATFALSVKSKPHGKHHGAHKTSHIAREKDMITEETNEPRQVVPTLEASSQVQEDEEPGSEGNANANKKDQEFEETDGAGAAVLLSEEELVELLKKEAEEEEREQKEEEVEEDNEDVESGEAVRSSEEEQEVMEERVMDEVEVGQETKQDEDDAGIMADSEDSMALLEETGSTESEVPLSLDYAADTGLLQTASAGAQSLIDGPQHRPEPDVPPSMSDDYDQDVQNTEAADSEEASDLETSPEDKDEKDKDEKDKESRTEPQEGSQHLDPPEPKSHMELDSGKEEDKSKNDSGGNAKGRTRKQKKNQRPKNHSPQREEAQTGQDQNRQGPQESESSSTDNTVHKAKRRRAGKWGPLVGMNPVQIRATVELYPSPRPSVGGGTHDPESPADPCDNFHCKRGKMCKVDADSKPGCVCQDPSACPPAANEFDHVCGTDNQTYDSSCELFATKCNLEGTKRGHRLHLDYTGPCKLIPPCVDAELVQFPLRMRDWLKNVLLQLYEHDSTSPGYLTPKQRFRVKKIFESERRLRAGDHSVELLVQDFEKNYNMYIYPVHWQFAQLDQHPSDRLLTHSELAPLRVPLVPMEHCTSRFFQECDADKDKQVSFKEWTSCFGIRNEDMDVNLLF